MTISQSDSKLFYWLTSSRKLRRTWPMTLHQSLRPKCSKKSPPQLVGQGKTQRHSTLQSRQTFSQIQCHYWWTCVKQPWPNYAPLCPQHPFYALLYSNYLHFAADRKQLVTSYPTGLWGRPTVHDKRVQSRDPRLNRTQEIPPEAVGGGIFKGYLNFHNCQPEVSSDIISGMAVQHVGTDVSNLVFQRSKTSFRPFFERQ